MRINPEKTEKLLAGIFLSSGYRIYRHAILIIVMTVISIYIVINHPEATTNPSYVLYGITGYNIVVLLAAYINICILIPRFLLKDLPFYYFLSVVGLVLFSMLLLLILQITLFDLDKTIQVADGLVVAVNFLSSIIILGLMIAGVTSFVLIKHWHLSTQRVDQLQEASLQSELSILKSQINPHFLFNVINNANVLLKDKQGGASGILFKLEDLLRYQINEAAREEISLASDMNFLTDYLNLEKVRHDKYDFSIVTEGDLENLMLPPLLFIPFIENAVKYSQDSEKPSYTHIIFKADKDEFFFNCENSIPEEGIGYHKAGGLGLKNIRRRLELLFPGHHRLDTEAKTDKYIVNLYLKLHTRI